MVHPPDTRYRPLKKMAASFRWFAISRRRAFAAQRSMKQFLIVTRTSGD
jgi:hypothetical protein